MSRTADTPTTSRAATAPPVASVAEPPLGIAPVLLSPPQVAEAPGRGILPSVSGHNAATSQLCELDAQPFEQLSPGLQIAWITEGRAEVYSQGRKFFVKAGDALDIGIFAPGRQDWIDGTAAYCAK